MSYQVLARKWRPKSFRQLVGQEHIIQALVNGLDQNRVHHAFLFTGTRGVGKTTIARILAKCLNCETGVSSTPCGECASCIDIDDGRFVDVLEINAADRTGVDETRDLLDSMQYTPSRGHYKVYIIDEVHMLSKSSFNALLKTLEEPPPHVKFVLATTNPESIPVTILSRCLQFNLRRLLPAQIQGYLAEIVQSEGIAAEPGALALLSRAADGSMRDGLSLLDQAVAFSGGKLSAEQVLQMLGLVSHEHIAAMITALAEGDAATLLSIVAELVAQSREADNVLTNLAETLHRICLVQCVPGYKDAERTDWESVVELASKLAPEDAQLYYQIATKGREELGIAPDPRTGLEMTLLRMLAFRPPGDESQQPSGGSQSAPGANAGGKSANTTRSVARSAPAASPGRVSARTPPVTPGPAFSAASTAQADDMDWLSLAGRLKLSGQVRELARNVHLKSRSDDSWEFSIPSSLKHLGSAACVDRLSRALSEQLGHAVMVRLIDDESADLRTQASLDEQQLRITMTDAERAINEDPVIQSLKERFGARIIEDSIQPLQ
jgi:DNA polymerase-3 subunit gamma/tau